MKDERSITPLPKSMPIIAVLLLILGIASIPLISRLFTPQQLTRNALLNGIPFILIFVSIVLFFMSFVWVVANRLNDRVSNSTFQLVERILIGGIVLGVVFMFQPWFFPLFRYGFYILIFSTLAFIVWSHVTPQPPIDDLSEDFLLVE